MPSNERSTKPGKYVGQIVNQIRHGKGKYTYHNSFFSYDGAWIEGVKHGKGTLSMRDGGFYKGDFNNGEITGRGERSWASGNFYTGEFDLGELSGKGQMKYADGRRYEGQWLENKYEGSGMLHSGDGDIYTGQFHLHKRHGDGEQVWGDGRRYEGGWVSDKPHGHGHMTFADGSTYEGQFNHGLKQGQGTYVHCTGITYSGLWIHDEIPPEEFASGMALVGASEIEISQGEPFSIEVAVLHLSGDVMEGDSGRVLQTKAGLLSPPADKSSKVRSEQADSAPTFSTPMGEAKLVNLAEVTPRARVSEYEDIPEKDRPVSRSGYEYIRLPSPQPTSTDHKTHCGHASWTNVVIPGHEMLEVVDSEDEEAEPTEETKPKNKKKGKNSPAPGRKDRSATPDERDRWRVQGARAERDKDLLKFGAPGTYVVQISDITEPQFFGRALAPIFLKVHVQKIKKSSTKFLVPKSPSVSRKGQQS